jgi:hypothetical protein
MKPFTNTSCAHLQILLLLLLLHWLFAFRCLVSLIYWHTKGAQRAIAKHMNTTNRCIITQWSDCIYVYIYVQRKAYNVMPCSSSACTATTSALKHPHREIRVHQQLSYCWYCCCYCCCRCYCCCHCCCCYCASLLLLPLLLLLPHLALLLHALCTLLCCCCRCFCCCCTSL